MESSYSSDHCRGCGKELRNLLYIACISCNEKWELSCANFTEEEYDFIMAHDCVDFVCKFCDDDEPWVPVAFTRKCMDNIINDNITRITEEIEVLRYIREELRNDDLSQLTHEAATSKHDLAETSEELYEIFKTPPTTIHQTDTTVAMSQTSLLSIYTHNTSGTWNDSTVPDGVVNVHTNFQEWRHDCKKKSGANIEWKPMSGKPFLVGVPKSDTAKDFALLERTILMRLQQFNKITSTTVNYLDLVSPNDVLTVEAADQPVKVQPRCRNHLEFDRTGIGVTMIYCSCCYTKTIIDEDYDQVI